MSGGLLSKKLEPQYNIMVIINRWCDIIKGGKGKGTRGQGEGRQNIEKEKIQSSLTHSVSLIPFFVKLAHCLFSQILSLSFDVLPLCSLLSRLLIAKPGKLISRVVSTFWIWI